MRAQEINPDAIVLQQVREHWQKIAAFLIYKLVKPGESVTITLADMQAFEQQPAQNLLTHGHVDSFEFKLVTLEEAERLVSYDAQQRGRYTATKQ